MDMRAGTAVLLALIATVIGDGVLPKAECAEKSLVCFKSRDFHNILHWKEPSSTMAKPVLYSVQYKIYGEEGWSDKKECQNITALSCDLTEETNNIREHYYARVTANCVVIGCSKRFSPLQNTVLGPPTVSISRGLRSLNLTVKMPTGPDNKTAVGDYIPSSRVTYLVNLTHHGWTDTVRTNSSQIHFNHLEKNQKYQLSVQYVLISKRQSEALKVVARTLDDPESLTIIIIVSVLLAALILLSVLLGVCQMSVRRKSPIPVSLNLADSGRSLPPLQYPAESITALEVYTHVTPVSVCKNPSPYTPQDATADPGEEPWHCQSYLGQQGEPSERSNSIRSSTNYSLVFVQPAGTSEGAGRASDPVGGERNSTPQVLTLTSDHSVTSGALGKICLPFGVAAEDSSAGEETGPLMLEVFRRSDGGLEVTNLLSLLKPEEEWPGAANGGMLVGVRTDTGVAVKEGGTSYLPNQAPPPPCAGPPVGSSYQRPQLPNPSWTGAPPRVPTSPARTKGTVWGKGQLFCPPWWWM
ncbi:hypothetical protein AGOR_G00119880 [Albula goreensis]|uniref:Fibronectin type-III domain-containing protein n=1 Tax=Albula goreensis TaxID=1534307 RepID=A0A8T3DBH5_9TELE|nr:hypothetical protein AGOR_G00119880 [Albula goreensis]